MHIVPPLYKSKPISTAARTAVIWPNGKLLWDVDTKVLYVGDGETLGGAPAGSGGGGGGLVTTFEIMDLTEDEQAVTVVIPEGSGQHTIHVYCDGFADPYFTLPTAIGNGRKLTISIQDPLGYIGGIKAGTDLVPNDYKLYPYGVTLDMVDADQDGAFWQFSGIYPFDRLNHVHDASEITTGTLGIERLPPVVMPYSKAVANQAARYALTIDDVQLADTVKQIDTNAMWYVVDVDNLDNANGYVQFSAATDWTNVIGKPSTFPPSSHTHPKSEITDLGTIGTAAALNVPASGNAGSGEVAKGNDTRLTRFFGLVEQWSGSVISTVANGDINLIYKARYAMTIDTLDIKTTSGTCSAAVKINTTAVTGLSAVSVSSTNASANASGANTVAAGDQVLITISSNSSGTNLIFNLQTTRT